MKKRGLPLVWESLIAENSNLSAYLDRVIEKGDAGSCWLAKGQRKRTKQPHKRRPRKWVAYGGKRHQPSLARLALVRQNGAIGEGDASHLCLKNPWCCNPDHLFESSREFNQAYDGHVSKELNAMLKKDPTGHIGQTIVPVSTIPKDASLPQGWPTRDEIIADQPELARAPDMIVWEIKKPKQNNK